MRKSFTRLFSVFILFCMMSLQVVAQVPTIGSLSPVDGYYPVERTGVFEITMNTPVKAVYNGTISLNNYNGTEYVPFQLQSGYETTAGSGVFNAPAGALHPWSVTFSGTKVTINFGYTLSEFSNYYITVNENTIQNAAGTERFAGLKPNGPGTLTKGNDDPDWDFTTRDVQPPQPVWSLANANCPDTNPTDEELNVSPSDSVFCLKFTEGVKWATGITPATLKVGDIALYESTDAGVYGGDVVFPLPNAVQIDPVDSTLLRITWPAKLPSLAKLYVRIKPGIITDLQDLSFAGFNTNGTGTGIGWNFSTKDATVPTRTFEMDTCLATTNFFIFLNETGIKVAEGPSGTPLSSSNVNSFVEFSGGAFNATVSTSGSNTIITIDPTAALTSGGTYTVSLKAGLWDSGDNAIPATLSPVFTAGDYTSPTTDILTWKNPDGTSFNINLRVNNEPAGTNTTYYYIVVKADDVKNSAGTNMNFYQPEHDSVLFNAATNSSVLPIGTATYHWEGSTTITPDNDDKNIVVYQRGTILAPANTELLEHVVSLPESHGTDWVVYLFGADGSLCGSNAVPGVTSTSNVTGVQNITPSTYDILEPEVSFTAELVNPSNDTISGCGLKVGKTGTPKGIKRMGPVYIHFNEKVENANGTEITLASIKSAVTLFDGVVTYPINDATSKYDSVDKRMVIYPTIPFGSGVQLIVTLGANRIQDAMDSLRFGPNGTELLNQESYDHFCVEAYNGPVVTISPCTATEKLDRAGDIVIYADQDLYAPAVDGGGFLSNDTLADNYVGKYLQVRKHGVLNPSLPADGAPNTELLRDAGIIVYQGDNPVNSYLLNRVTITVEYPTSGDGDSTIITISPKDITADFWESETWYSLEIDQTLRSVDLLDLTTIASGSACTIDNYWGYFMAEDSREPLCIFYEDEPASFDVNEILGAEDPLLDGNITVADTSNIRVSIDEWIQLGFDGFKDLEITDVIEDANALRRYFALYEVNGTTSTPISFDVKYFTLGVGDIADFYIDPYYPNGVEKNWTKGKNYKVCFIDNRNEFADYIDDPALTDDNLNGVATVCANFTCPADVVPPTCLISATVNGFPLYTSGTSTTDIPVTSDSIVTLQLCFDVPVDQPVGGIVSIMRGATTVQTAAMLLGSRSGDYKCISYTFDMHGETEWVDNSIYSVEFSGTGLITNTVMGCSYPSSVDPFNDIHTIDGSAPRIVSFIPDLIGPAPSQVPGCLFDKDSTDIIIVWDETVAKQAGKKLEIWRDSIFGGTGQNALIITLDAAADNTVAGDAIMRIPNVLFKDMLQYNTAYYIHIPAGFVKNAVLLDNAGVTTDDTLRFCVGPDPAPRMLCGKFSPIEPTNSESTTPWLTIEFSEPVAPVNQIGRDIQVYRNGPAYSVNDAYLHAPASAFVEVAGSGSKKWRLNTATAFATAGVYSQFKVDSCYDVNIAAGAFKEISGSQTTSALITNTINGALTQSACTWTFCIGDDVAPTISFWPVNTKEHVPTNAHLYAYISELPIIDALGTATPLNVTNVKPYFTLTRGVGAVVVPFDVEYVGNDIVGGDNQKQRIRIIPRDPMGPDWSLSSTTPSMMADSLYTLSFNNLGSLQDAAGNNVVNNSTTFRVEDILCPVVDGGSFSYTSSADSVWATGSMNEAGKVRFVVVADGATAPAASAVWGAGFTDLGLTRGETTVPTTASPNFDFAFRFGLNPIAAPYGFDVFVYVQDDEVDLFDTDAKITLEWPYTMTPTFETEVYRIKDLRPSPNWCNSNTLLNVSLCDNDKPIFVKSYPVDKGVSDAGRNMNFPVGDSLVLIFNEDIQINDGNTGNKIVLRDAHNNLGVPLAYRVFGGDTLILYPLDSALIGNEAEAFMPWHAALGDTIADLEQERDYYLEIDRWAISDVDGCGSTVNYFGEWVGKEKLAFRTEDNTGPCFISHTPTSCVEPEADLTVTLFERNTVLVNAAQAPADSAFVYIYKVGQIDPHERIPASWITGPVILKPKTNPNDWTFTIPTTYAYLSKGTYRVRIPNGMFTDNSGNADCGDGYEWTFDVRDYEDPIASWTLIQDYTYLNVAYTDPEYQGRITSGPAGATANDVPTSSLLKVEFNEDVYVWDNESNATDKWTLLGPKGSATTDEIAAAITIRETVGGVTTTLTYDSDGYGVTPAVGNWEFTEIGADYAIIRVYRAQDHWTPSLTSQFVIDAGMKSNATYTMAVAAAVFSDDEDCDLTRNIFDGANPLVTINTRDDVPPTLTITDANDVAVCGTKCVAEGPTIKLHFSGKVVKTPYAGIDYDNPSSPFYSGGVNWWSNSNLPLLPADLMQTFNGDFLTFYATNEAGTTVGDSVRLSGVTVDPNGQDITLTLASDLTSQGWYKIAFAGGSVKDQKRVPDGNEFIGMSCMFRVKDTVLPFATAFFPADDNDGVTTHISNVLGSSSLSGVSFGPDSMAVAFNEAIAKSNSAENIIIRRLNGQIFDEISLSETRVKNNVLVFKANALEEFTSYYVEIPAGFVTDTTSCERNGNVAIDPEVPYATGDRFAWNFTTADDTPPTPIVYIPNDTDTVPRNSNLTIIFDENIQALYDDCKSPSDGVYIYHHDNTVGWVGNPAVDFGNIVEFIPFWSTSTIPNYALEGTDIYNGFNKDKIIFNPTNDFTRIGTYYIRVSGDCIKDGQGNFWAGLGDSTTWKFTVTNDVAPVLASTDPFYDHNTPATRWQYVELPADDHGYVTANLSMFFVDEIYGEPLTVAPGTGMLKIMEYRYNPATYQMEEKLWKEIDINDPSVFFNAQTGRVDITGVTLRDNINKTFGAYEECYYILADRGTVTNGYPGSQTFWGGIDNAFVWRFQTGADDVFVPGYDIISWNIVEHGEEAQNLTIEAASTLEVTFNEGIEALTAPAGKVQIFKVGEAAFVEEVTVLQSMVQADGVTLKVPLTALVDETNYYVQVQAGAFGDTSTVSTPNFAFGGADVWAFQTGDNTAPAAITLVPAEGDGCVEAATTLTMTFNESRGVVKGSGNLEVVDGEGTVIDQVAAEDILISEDGNTVSIMVEGLPDTTALTVNVPAGFLFDGDPHSPLPNAAFSWSFTTGENTVPVVVSITPDAATTADTVLVITFSEVVTPVAGKFVTIGEEAIAVEDFTTLDSIVYTLPLADLASEATYNVAIEEGAFIDANAGCVPNEVAATTETFTVGDLIAPLVIGSPETVADYIGLVLSLNFTDAVTPATGDVKIFTEAGVLVETIAVDAPGKFTASADNTVYTFTSDSVRFGEYYILIDAGAFVDNSAAPAGVSCPGISDPAEWTLSVIDPEFVDCYHIIAPLRATQNVPVSTTVVIDFCEERIAAGVGAVSIADQNVEQVENVNFFYYPVTAEMIDGNKLSIDVTGLQENTTYSIIIPQGAITDEAGNPFIGITDANLWIFTTGDFTDPEVSVPTTTALNDGSAAPIAITSSEAGIVYLAKDDVAANAAALLAAIAQNKAVAATLTAPGSIDVDVEGLVVGTYKAYAFDASGRMGTATNLVTVTEIPPVTLRTIAEIQGTGSSSSLVGQVIRTKGTVTAVSSLGYYIQDANAAWSGIFVASTQVVGVGSSVEITGTVAEVSGITVINNVTKTEPIGHVVTVSAIAITGAVTENYESVLVKVEGRATAAAAVTGDWTAGTYAINNALYGSYTTMKDYNYQIEGIVATTKVLAIEIHNLSQELSKEDLSSAVKVYPNPFDKFITLDVSSNVVVTKAVITNIAGQLVKEVINPNNTIATSELRSGVYFISLHTVDGIAKTERIIKR